MRTEVQNQIKMLGNAVAAEVPKRRGTHRRWLRLAPADDGLQLIEVEVPAGVAPEEWPAEESDYVITSSETFDSLESALSALQARGVNTDMFEAVWKTETPF